ncbi:hypothetical protein B296_00058007, partial [Ensete ventricosum]
PLVPPGVPLKVHRPQTLTRSSSAAAAVAAPPLLPSAMGRRKGGNKALTPSGQKSGPAADGMNLDGGKEQEEAPEVVAIEEKAESSNLEDPPLIGSDKTSADYYFDSYSHFGIARSLSLIHKPFSVPLISFFAEEKSDVVV